jgi:hypothetical protein
MFIANSTIQSSTWGWTNRALELTSVANSSAVYGEFTGYTVANDGYAYAIPLNVAGTPLVNKVMVLSPGTCNTRYSNYTEPEGSFVDADGSPTKPNFTVGYSILNSKGILAPNGKIYYIRSTGYVYPGPINYQGLCILTPNNGDCTWEFYQITALSAGAIAGLILGKDGKLYIIPGSSTGSPYYSALVRLDISGSTIVEETSGWYTAVAGVNTSTGLAVSSVGNVVQLNPAVAFPSIPTNRMVTMQGNDDSVGVLNRSVDTYVVATNPTAKTITLNVAPDVAFNGAGRILEFGTFPKKVTNTFGTLFNGQYRGRMSTYFEKSLRANDYTPSSTANFNTTRNPQNGVPQNPAQSFPIYTAFLDPNPSSNKIYVFPHAGTQIFWIDPDNWDNKEAFTTSKNLSLTDLQIGHPGTVIPYGKSEPYLGNALKKISSVALGTDNKFYVTLSQFNTAATPLNVTLRKLMVIDTINNSVSFITANDVINEGSIYAQSGLNQLPNGAFFCFNTKSTTGLDAYKGFQEIFIDSSSAAKFYKNTNNDYGKGLFYPRGAYEENIPGDPQEQDPLSPGVRQPSGVTFGSSLDKNGKIIIPGNRTRYGLEYLSVKGFYDADVTNFKLIDPLYLDIPEDLNTLPSSVYNLRLNMPL